MCNDFGNKVPYSAYLEAFSQIRAPVVFPKAAPNLEPRDDIWPTETAPVFRRRGEGVELVQLRWGFPPARPKGAPVINFRSEGRRFPKGRCLIPASHFFEFTGRNRRNRSGNSPKPAKTGSASPACGVRCQTGQGTPSRCSRPNPGPDVAPIHDRQMVVLDRPDWLAWLDLTGRNPSCFARCPPGAWRSNRFARSNGAIGSEADASSLYRSGSGRN